jgi:hypothetical protein
MDIGRVGCMSKLGWEKRDLKFEKNYISILKFSLKIPKVREYFTKNL